MKKAIIIIGIMLVVLASCEKTDVEISGIIIDKTNFPNDSFRESILRNVDDDKNGYLSETEIKNIRKIRGSENYCEFTIYKEQEKSEYTIRDEEKSYGKSYGFSGIDEFVYLEEINIESEFEMFGESESNIDLKNHSNLKKVELEIPDNNLSFDFSDLENIESIFVKNNKSPDLEDGIRWIDSVKISNSPKLCELHLEKVDNLIMEVAPSLSKVYLEGVTHFPVDVITSGSKLKELYINSYGLSDISEMIFEENDNFESLTLMDNPKLNKVDLSACPNVEYLCCCQDNPCKIYVACKEKIEKVIIDDNIELIEK
ncbi:MAG: hypothetical protein IKQ71_10175 [Lachnospiraceae bacterium]|nr:hypothetical protein [Lachnospiraceae bacterium]